jgi:hypothetical protein
MQQINLYQGVLIDKPEPLQSRQVGMILLGFLLLLGLMYLFSFMQLNGTREQEAGLQSQQNEMSSQVLLLEQQYPRREKNALLDEQIKRLEAELAEQKQLIGYFSSREQGGNVAILQILQGLAEHRQQGVWLRRIYLDGSGRRIHLAGSALRPQQVPAYLQLLGEQDVFNGQEFASLKLARLQERPGQIDFSLESTPGEAR